MQIFKKVNKKNGFVPMDADEQTLYNIFAGAFHKPTYEAANIPEARTFSQLQAEDQQRIGDEAQDSGYDIGDGGKEADKMFGDIQAELLLVGLLEKFSDRDKVIILFQVARGAGYRLTHEDCAQTLSITRERYMVLLKSVKKRAAKILQIPAE